MALPTKMERLQQEYDHGATSHYFIESVLVSGKSNAEPATAEWRPPTPCLISGVAGFTEGVVGQKLRVFIAGSTNILFQADLGVFSFFEKRPVWMAKSLFVPGRKSLLIDADCAVLLYFMGFQETRQRPRSTRMDGR